MPVPLIRVLLLLLSLACVLAACAGCHPLLPPVTNCAPHVYRCTAEGTPEVCSASGRFEPVGDTPCPGSCALTDAGLAYCAPPRIGAVDAGGDR